MQDLREQLTERLNLLQKCLEEVTQNPLSKAYIRGQRDEIISILTYFKYMESNT